MKKTALLMIILVFIQLFCAKQEKSTRKVEELSLTVTDTLFGPEFQSNGIFLGAIMDIALDSAGNFWILDIKDMKIKVFDKNLTYLRSIGNRGSGPGEFQAIVTGIGLIHDTLYTYQVPLGIITVFHADGEYMRTIEGKNFPSTAFQCVFLDDSGFLLTSEGFRVDYLACMADRSGEIIQKYATFSGTDSNYIMNMTETQDQLSRGEIPASMQKRVLLAARTRDEVFLVYHYPPKIEKYNPEGKLVKSIALELAEELQEAVENVKEENLDLKRKGDVASFSPFRMFRSVQLDGNRLYVQFAHLLRIDVYDVELNKIQTITVPEDIGSLGVIDRGSFYFYAPFDGMTVYRCHIGEPLP